MTSKPLADPSQNSHDYSIGESPDDSNRIFDKRLADLDKECRDQRLSFLWHLAFTKAKGASKYLKLSQNNSVNVKVNGLINTQSLSLKNKRLLETELKKEEELKEEENNVPSEYLIYPSNQYKRAWDMIVLVLILYTASWVPIKVCFIDESGTAQFVFDLMVDFFFLTDIVLTFFTVTQDLLTHKMETRMKVLACNYLKGSFTFDLVSSLPL